MIKPNEERYKSGHHIHNDSTAYVPEDVLELACALRELLLRYDLDIAITISKENVPT